MDDYWTVRLIGVAVALSAIVPATSVGAQPADEPADDQPAPVISRVSLECDLPLCSDPTEVDKFLDIAGIYPGRNDTEALRQFAAQRLEKTGVFKEITFERRSVAAGGVELVVEGIGATRIRDIEFKGSKPPPFRADLRKLLIYRQGEAYEGDMAKRNTQLESLEAEFEEEGYFGTDITMEVVPREENSKQVDVIFRVDKGERLDICEIGIRGLEAMDYPEARRQLLSGVSFFARRLELVPPRYTTAAFKEGTEALVDAYRQMGYFQARIIEKSVQTSFEDGCVTILVDVDEGPIWELEFNGNTVFNSRELSRELPFYQSGYVDREEIRRAERTIRQLYETRGYPFARVQGVEVRRDRLHRTLRFEIQEGERLEIAEVRFHGNEALSDRQLAEGLGTKPFEIFESGGFLQTEQLLNDLRRIESKYYDRGYLRAYVDRYALNVRPQKGDLTVDIYIREGRRVRASDVRLEGVRSISRSRIAKQLNVQKGEPFVSVRVRADKSRIDQLYSGVGYPLAEVETRCVTVDGEAESCDRPRMAGRCVANSLEALEGRCKWQSDQKQRWVCRRVDQECGFEGGIGGAERVRVTHRVDEGPLVTTGELLVQGNFRTRDAVIEREIPLESGDIFDVRKILQGQSNLRSLGIFDSVSIEAIGLDASAAEVSEQRAALLVSVEESRNRFLDFKFGLEGRDLLGDRRKILSTAEIQYSDRNLLGSALQLEPTIFAAADLLQATGAAIDLLSGNLPTSPRVDYLLGAELSFRHPRFLKKALGVDKLLLTVTPFYLIDLLGVTNDQLLREEWGLALEVRKELSEILDRFFVSLGFEGKQTATAPLEAPVRDGERIFSPRRITGKLIPKLTLDRRDSPLNPSKGFFLRLQPELVSGDALSPEIDTFDDSYLRLTWKSDLFVPLWPSVVLAQSLRFGQVVPFGGRDTRVPADERFFLGGAGSVRGYPNNSLGPTLNDQPAGGEFLMNYNIEVRFPLIAGAGLRGATFFDTGLLVDCFDDDDPTRRVGCYADAFQGTVADNIRTSAGIGLRYVIADQIPLLFDYGIALDRTGNEGIGNLHFHLGYTF